MSKISLSSLTPRQKQLSIAGGILLAVMTAALVGVTMTENANKRAPLPGTPAITTNIAAPGSQIDTKDVWMGRSAQDIRTVQDKNKELEDRIHRLEQELKTGGQSSKSDTGFPDLPPALGMKSSKYPLMPPGAPGMSDEKMKLARGEIEAQLAKEYGSAPQDRGKPRVLPPPPGAATSTEKSVPSSFPPASALSSNNASGAQQVVPGIMNVSFNSAGAGSLVAGQATGKGNSSAIITKAREKSKDNYMPSGSFIHGILLSGLDAPTGAQSQSNPHPLLIRLTDLSVLPNRARFDVKECFVVGAGYGDLSSERAFIRTETLSCITNSGKVIDQEIKGFAAGDDGKAGVRGRLVTKQGQVLAAALLAGVASGIGNAFQQQQTTTSISPLGATQTLNKDQVVNAGVAGGVHTSMDMLARYYIKLAEQLFPVIEIDAARQVEVILTRGMFFGDESKDLTQAADNKQPTAVPARNINGNPQARYTNYE